MLPAGKHVHDDPARRSAGRLGAHRDRRGSEPVGLEDGLHPGGTHQLYSPDGTRYTLGKKFYNWNVEVADSIETAFIVAASA